MSKVWFITGASSGLGKALALAALARGDKVALAARRRESLEEIAQRNSEHALTVSLDVTDPSQRRAALDAALGRFGRIDVLANIAGSGSLGAAEEFSTAQLLDQLAVNFIGAAELTRELMPTLRSQRSGHVLMLTSVLGLVSYPGFAPYCASKFALEGWSEALHTEVAPLGIKVTIVEPGAFRTDFLGDRNMRAEQRVADYRPVIDPIERHLNGNDGQQRGDPAKAALAMLAVVDHANPPLRLMLGADAYSAWEKKRAALDAELAAWRAIGEATAFDWTEVRPVGG
ncbi:oxidoreductase [Paraburkholderia elongata]|uniref:SDR family NAD(P)-dependent oxidoreductase n=1 Tax=Paraburkholderia elongata TaxID=2675747 RepID=A0A972NVV0_9BURK|nr:oxidoreductase [Paraburkholderia elongata]NPT59872.1 SDR family NAD(P)-dependent oxidoreductase [Paraburkholderia elongata]